MTTATHTPGLWGLTFGEYDAAIHAGATIAMIDDTMSAWKANARLIAAAPDLLAALDAIVAKAHEYGNRSDTPDNVSCGFYDIIEDARAAIAKATGQDAP